MINPFKGWKNAFIWQYIGESKAEHSNPAYLSGKKDQVFLKFLKL
jgi:hypothetical protein